MIKKAGYYIFAMFFSLFRVCPINKNKVFFVATHDDSDEGNIGIVAAALKEKMPDMKFCFLTKRDGIRHPFSFFVTKCYHMATAGTIFLDNVFMPMAYTPISSKVNVVQLWHGTGSIKKFGLDSDSEEVARVARKGNQRITHLVVNSEMTKQQYAGAFEVPVERIFKIGLPRTDLLLNEEKLLQKKTKFYEKYSELRNKKCILYAPTFRDDEVENPTLQLDLDGLMKVMSEDEVLLLRLHPHVAEKFSDERLAKYQGKVVNMSGYSGVTTLLVVSDCLITDYSSIVFEYCLLNRPMVFYAYDLDVFQEEGRDFYVDYENFVPGPVVKTQKDLEDLWKKGFEFDKKAEEFPKRNYEFLDKNAVNRLFELIFEN